MRYAPDFETFSQLAADGYTRIPVHRRLLGDSLTPVSAFARVRGNGHAFLLESVVGGNRVGRHSFIAFDPVAVYEPNDATTDPLAELQAHMGAGRFWRDPNLPSFTGGAVGFAGYDLMRFYEPEKLGQAPTDDRHLPDVHFGIYDRLLIFDHVDKTVRAVANATIEGDVRAAYDAACRRCDDLVERLAAPSPLTLGEIDLDRPLSLDYDATLDQAGYEAAVRAGKQYIAAGDIFQFVPSLRLRVQSGADPLDVYRALRVINPSPFMFYLETPTATLIGSSPEILCRVEDGVVESRPLAGTRRRGATDADDAAMEKELREDPKDTAEHAMLVDLHRNDVGRVADVGTVELREAFTVERYSHVMHLSSDVIGKLKSGMTALDALRVSLPVGTVSGAPKIRAMQIIDELEPVKRGPYGGAVGYLDFAGNLDTCIALRTIVHTDNTYDVQAGAGVVADSVPTSEWRECMNKAEALLRAVDVAQAGFDG